MSAKVNVLNLPKATGIWLLTTQVRNQEADCQRKTTRPFTSRPALPVFRRRYCTLTGVSRRQPKWKPYITRQQRTTAFSAYRLYITQAPSFIGWVRSGHAAAQFS